MLRLDQNRARAQIAGKCGVGVAKVEKCIIWGNHSSTQFPDAFHATVDGKPVPEVSTFIGNYKVLFHVYLIRINSFQVVDDAWLKETFIPTVQKRGAAVIAARKLSSAMSAAKAASDHMKDWFQVLAFIILPHKLLRYDRKLYGLNKSTLFGCLFLLSIFMPLI